MPESTTPAAPRCTEEQLVRKQMPSAADFRTAARCTRWVLQAIHTRPWWERWFMHSPDQYSKLATAFESAADMADANKWSSVPPAAAGGG
jgi:hypothetical protein